MRDRIEKTRARNRVKAQLHRWYSFYERPGLDPADQLELLALDVFIHSTLAQCRGHEEALRSFAALPKGARHTHRLEAFDAENGPGGSLRMTAKIIYQTIGADSVLHSSSLDYAAELVAGSGPMPRFKEILITLDKGLDLTQFVDAYAEHRALATLLTALSVASEALAHPGDERRRPRSSGPSSFAHVAVCISAAPPCADVTTAMAASKLACPADGGNHESQSHRPGFDSDARARACVQRERHRRTWRRRRGRS